MQVLLDVGYEGEGEGVRSVAYCGRQSAQRPSVIWSADPGYQTNIYTHVRYVM